MCIRDRYSSAKARVKFVTAPFAALYALIPQSPPRPDTDERLTMQPFVFRRWGSASRDAKYTLSRSVPMTFRQSCVVVCAKGPKIAIPALLTNTSSFPNLLTVSSTRPVSYTHLDVYKRQLEYGSRGVRINAVAPSFTSTEATVDFEKIEAVMAAFRDRLPIGRAATPDDIAGVICLLYTSRCV